MNPRNSEGSAPLRRLVVACAQILLIGTIAAAQVASTAAQTPGRASPQATTDRATPPAPAAAPPPAPSERSRAASPRTALPRPFFVFDLDADGALESITREMRWSLDQPARSAVVINSGADGFPLQVLVGPEPNDLFGWLTTCMGDLDHDGTPDLAIAAPRAHNGAGSYGRVYIVSGATGQTISTVGTTEPGFFGLGLVPVHDADGDGAPDLIVAAMHPVPFAPEGDAPPEGDGSGVVGENVQSDTYYAYAAWRLVSTMTGETLAGADGHPDPSYFVPGESLRQFWISHQVPGQRLWLAAASGDLNADGVVNGDDLRQLIEALGAPDQSNPGAGDLNGDGATDLRDLMVLMSQYGKGAEEIARNGAPAREGPTTAYGDVPGDPCSVMECKMECPDCEFGEPIDSDDNEPSPGGPICPYNTPDCDVNCLESPCQPGCSGAGSCACSSGCCGSNPCGSGCPGSGSPCCQNPCGPGCEGAYFTECCADPCKPGCPRADPCLCDPCADGCPDACGCNPCGPGCSDANSCYCNPCDASCPPSIDITMDVNNDGVIDDADDDLELQPEAMRVLVVNRGDLDEDGIPDYADGFGAFGADSFGPVPGTRFARLRARLSGVESEPGLTVSFVYDHAPLTELTREEVLVEDIESSYFRYHRGHGLLRVWRKNANDSRDALDFVPSGLPMPATDFSCGDTIFYIEAVNGHPVPTSVSMCITTTDGNSICDTVEVLPFDSLSGLVVDEIAGFTILRGSSVAGTPGKDIIIGTAGDDQLIGGDGDDIIVAQAGDDFVLAGPGGDDVVFASKGTNSVCFDDCGIARPVEERADPGNGDRVIDEEDRPFTTEQVLKAYTLLYGENDPWLSVYLSGKGRIEAVEGDGVPFSESDWDCVRHPSNNFLRPVIQLQFSIADPFEAATRMRTELLDAADSTWPCGLRSHFEQTLVDALFNAAATQNHVEFQYAQDRWLELRSQALNDALQLTAFVGGTVIEGIRFFSVGADVVVGVAALAEGDFEELINLLPLVPTTVTGAAKVLAKVGDVARLEKVDGFIRHFPNACRGGACPARLVGWKWKREIPVRYGPPVGGHRTVIINKGDVPHNSNSGTAHGAYSEWLADEYARTGDIEYIVQDRSLREATGLDGLGNQAAKEPDLVIVGRDGRISLVEIQSPSQSEPELRAKLRAMMLAIPEELRGDEIFVPKEHYYNP